MPNGEEILRELFEKDNPFEGLRGEFRIPAAPTPVDEKPPAEGHSQWALGGNDTFIPVGKTILGVPAGIYAPFSTPSAWGIEKLAISSDGIYTLPETAMTEVLTEIHTFWSKEERYRHHNLLYKRGLLLWGPPGGGKTVMIKLLMQEIIKKNGIVVIVNSINLTQMILKAIRRIEPRRNLIVVFEDIDEIISQQGEAAILSMLDGEQQIDNLLNLASTNYPERLGARIVNRPSRFDRRVYIGMPGFAAREVYLAKATQGNLSAADISRWVTDTDGMSIAHLRELVAAVYCLEQPYEDVLERLRALSIQPKGEDGFKKHDTVGFSEKLHKRGQLASGYCVGGG